MERGRGRDGVIPRLGEAREQLRVGVDLRGGLPGLHHLVTGGEVVDCGAGSLHPRELVEEGAALVLGQNTSQGYSSSSGSVRMSTTSLCSSADQQVDSARDRMTIGPDGRRSDDSSNGSRHPETSRDGTRRHVWVQAASSGSCRAREARGRRRLCGLQCPRRSHSEPRVECRAALQPVDRPIPTAGSARRRSRAGHDRLDQRVDGPLSSKDALVCISFPS